VDEQESKVSEAEKLYEDGKHRRYNLLFAANGGAFAVAKLFAESQKCPQVLGELKLTYLATGMALFSVAMTFDLWTFGLRMRKRSPAPVFRWPGQLVLSAIGLLLAAGWILVGCGG
jgi:hypothetical protein